MSLSVVSATSTAPVMSLLGNIYLVSRHIAFFLHIAIIVSIPGDSNLCWFLITCNAWWVWMLEQMLGLISAPFLKMIPTAICCLCFCMKFCKMCKDWTMVFEWQSPNMISCWWQTYVLWPVDSHWVQWGQWHWKFQISFWHDSCFCNEIASSRNTELKNIKCRKRCAGRLAKKDCANEFAKRGCIYCLKFMKSEDSLTDHCIQCQYVDASPIGQVSNCHFFPYIFVQLLSLGMEVFQNVLTSPILICVWSFPYVWKPSFWSYRS